MNLAASVFSYFYVIVNMEKILIGFLVASQNKGRLFYSFSSLTPNQQLSLGRVPNDVS